jgi:hypothetical protein
MDARIGTNMSPQRLLGVGDRPGDRRRGGQAFEKTLAHQHGGRDGEPDPAPEPPLPTRLQRGMPPGRREDGGGAHHVDVIA